MTSSPTATTRSSVPSSPHKKSHEGGHTTKGALSSASATTRQRGFTKGHAQRIVPQGARSGKPLHQHGHKRQNNDSERNVLLQRLSLPSSPSSGTLLERIGKPIEDEAASTLTGSDEIQEGRASDKLHVYTPEPGEVERFLESVIGALPSAPSPPSPGRLDACSPTRTKKLKPALALETHLPVDHLVKVQEFPRSAPYSQSPDQTAVNSLPSVNPTLDHCQQSPLLGDTMPSPSASTLEECRKNLIPVLVASAQARDPSTCLDEGQCRRLLSDDHCKRFFRKSKEMKLQLSSRASERTPADVGRSHLLKRDRTDDVDAWARNTSNGKPNTVSSVNVVSDVSRRDSDVTLVEFPGEKLPPRMPRAMLRAMLKESLVGAQHGAPYEALVVSPTTKDRPASATPLTELVHQVIKRFPTPTHTEIPTGPSVMVTDAPNGLVGMLTGQAVSPTHAAPSTDFISHLLSRPGTWFRQRGGRHAEIVDVNIDVSDEVFYATTGRLRMHARLCSVPVDAVTKNSSGDSLDGLIECHAVQWPTKGKLVVQVNPESERSKTWLPFSLDSDPLDVTSCIRPGKNTFRFVQLSDLSDFTFGLVVSPPPPEEEWRAWDWASIIGCSRTGAPSTDDPTSSDLSEFAHVPVIILS